MEAALSDWYKTPLGQELIDQERSIVARAISGRFAANIVQLDSGYHEALFEKRLFGSGVIVSQLENRALCPVVCASPESLPFEPESLDMLLMHHSLDLCNNPYQVVREGAIALKPGGLMIVIGFNPISLWGLRSIFHAGRHGTSVWHSRFIRSGRVEDWMHLLDFEIERHEKHVFLPPVSRPFWLQKLGLCEKYFRKFLPFMGAVYVLVGYKQVLGKLPPGIRKTKASFLETALGVGSTKRQPFE
ncbi:class I SAM-dependent methyltransferase [Reinekea marinisedimentorum]|uniref:Methyltransferase family protein n=1 Tax=Reinekea marinisedimentorum TaxID=230495 RepID=A0A4R3IAR5_9GAMM|nr:methyltransferase domain-containing protein [Reinekea marinisedimentorum]TCS42617.1 methyltransferase family protein [Reinekea marinisedimentorum]